MYAYDALNRLTNTVYADGSANATVYDDLGRVKYAIDARGTVTAYGYDVAGQKIAVTKALGQPEQIVMTYAYDANSNRYQTTDALSDTTTFDYDALNQAVTNHYADNIRLFVLYESRSFRGNQNSGKPNGMAADEHSSRREKC